MDKSVVSALTVQQRALLTFYMDAFGSEATDVGLHKVRSHGNLGGRDVPAFEHYCAELVVRVRQGLPLHFYGTLGDTRAESGLHVDHEHQFVTLFDVQSSDIVTMLAYARMHHVFAASLDAHSSFLLDETSAMRLRGYSNVLLARADLLMPFREKNSVILEGMPMQLLALIPLEPVEWATKVQHGTDALFDEFQRRGRDLLTLRPHESSHA